MKKTIILTVILTGLSLLTHISLSFSAEWVIYSITSNGILYYDKENIKRMNDNKVRVWEQTIYSDTGKEEVRKELGDRYKDIESSIALWQIDCNEKKLVCLQATYYDSKRSIIYSADNFTGEERFIPPDTYADTLYKIVCKNE